MSYRLPAQLVEALADVRSVGVVTGAGVSVESGIRSYRGQGGLYDDPDQGDATVEALSGPVLRRDPDRTWRVLAELARSASEAEPNAGHRALVAIERHVDRFVLLTQNVDGLHQRAGSRNVIDIHGTTTAAYCMSCGDPAEALDFAQLAAAPRCHCGGVLRPDVVLFGEMLPPGKVQRLHSELLQDPPDLLVIAGTTAVFPYIAQPVAVAARAGRLTVEVNPEPTEVSSLVTHVLRAPSGSVLPALAVALGAEAS